MTSHEMSFVPLLIVATIAFAVPVLLSRLRRLGIPVVAGEIVAGIAVGKSGLDLVESGHLLRVLSDFGFAYLMFLSGLEIDFAGILGVRRGRAAEFKRVLVSPLFMGSAFFGLTLAGSAIAAQWLQRDGMIQDPWIVGLILATTSLGVVVPVLKENGLLDRAYGQSLLIAALIADFTSIMLISLYVILKTHGLTAEMLMILVLMAAFLATYRLIAVFRERLPLDRFFSRFSSATTQIRTRGAFALALVFIGLAETLGIENILGAFLAGVIISSLSKGDGTILRQKLDAIGYGFFIPVFFIMVGVGFDLPALMSSGKALLLVPSLIVISYAVKMGPALVYRARFSWRDTLAGGVLLSSRLSLIIAASAIGLEMGAISQAVNAAVILVAIVTSTLSPILFNRLSPRAGPRDRAIIIGDRPAALLLARSLRKQHTTAVLVLEESPPDHTVEETEAVFVSSGRNLLDTLRTAGAHRAHSLVAMDSNDDVNLRVCRAARRQFGVSNLIAWVEDLGRNADFRHAGARVVNPSSAAMVAAESMVLNPGMIPMNGDIDELQEVREVKLRNSALVGRSLGDVPLTADLTVLTIERRGRVLEPGRDTALQANDTITLVGDREAVVESARLFAEELSVESWPHRGRGDR